VDEPSAPSGQRRYRIVSTPEPTLADFMSHASRGLTLRNPTPELLDRWRGISVWETESQARLQAQVMAQRRRPLGEFIAELAIDDTLRCEQTSQPGHYTLWGDPAVLLRRLVRVVPV
jgi:hypothetical protein